MTGLPQGVRHIMSCRKSGFSCRDVTTAAAERGATSERPMPGAAGTDGDAGTALDSLRWNAYKSFLKAWKFNFIF